MKSMNYYYINEVASCFIESIYFKKMLTNIYPHRTIPALLIYLICLLLKK